MYIKCGGAPSRSAHDSEQPQPLPHLCQGQTLRTVPDLNPLRAASSQPHQADDPHLIVRAQGDPAIVERRLQIDVDDYARGLRFVSTCGEQIARSVGAPSVRV